MNRSPSVYLTKGLISLVIVQVPAISADRNAQGTIVLRGGKLHVFVPIQELTEFASILTVCVGGYCGTFHAPPPPNLQRSDQPCQKFSTSTLKSRRTRQHKHASRTMHAQNDGIRSPLFILHLYLPQEGGREGVGGNRGCTAIVLCTCRCSNVSILKSCHITVCHAPPSFTPKKGKQPQLRHTLQYPQLPSQLTEGYKTNHHQDRS